MTQAISNPRGIVVLPAGTHGRIHDDKLTGWLSRGRLAYAESQAETLLKVLDLLGEPAPASGLAALRFWGQTGERSGSWIAAADPMHLETRLHSLRMISLRPDELPKSELRTLFDHLQVTLAPDSGFAFARLGNFGYLRGEKSIATAPMSAHMLHGMPPDEFMPAGAAAASYHRLLGEIQMVLHAHGINQKRAEAGRLAVNSLWLWGGGTAAEPAERPLPRLFANDPLFRGYWLSCIGDIADWDGDIEKIAKDLSFGFVAVMPAFAPEASALALDDCLGKLRRMLNRGVIKSVSLLFRDGLSVEISRWDRVRFWRAASPLLKKTINDD